MVNNVIYANYTETYDMCTQVGKMSILGVHTPTADALKKMFRGFFEQYRKVKINSLDIVGVLASNLEALTPQEVGLESGQVNPGDVWNPILFKACTGESINLLLDRIYGATGSDNGSLHSLETTADADLDAYYTLLADDDFRKFHPQGGVIVRGLSPKVHKVVTTQPFKWENVYSSNGVPRIAGSGTNPDSDSGNYVRGFGSVDGTAGSTPSVFVSNGLTDMPWIDTTVERNVANSDSDLKLSNALATNIPKCYMGAFILPPSITTPLYMRWTFRWSISFKDFRPAYEIGPIESSDFPVEYGMNSEYSLYYNLYSQSSKMDNDYGSFDANSVDSVRTLYEKVA